MKFQKPVCILSMWVLKFNKIYVPNIRLEQTAEKSRFFAKAVRGCLYKGSSLRLTYVESSDVGRG